MIVLLQRGLRINAECQKLWQEYFKLEMLWVQKIKLRRKVLLDEEFGLDGVHVPTLEIEKESSKVNTGDIPDLDQSDLFEKALLEFTIPRAVYRNAIKGMNDCFKCSNSS